MSAAQKCIVVCDDDADTLDFLKTYLTTQGYCVSAAQGFSDILNALKTVKPDLFILDVFLPESDGFWIAAELQLRGYDIPIIFMTAFDQPSARMNAPVTGALEFMIKPLDADVLLQKIKKSIGVKPSDTNWNLKVTESRK